MENNYLTHHGIRGQKWGVRRYQNKDGTLTKAGQKRYNKEKERLEFELKKAKNQQRTDAKLNKLKAMEAELEAQKNKDKPKIKTVKDMSDDELRTAIARKQLENQYNQLFPPQVSAGKKFTEKMVNEVLVPSATKAGKNFLDKALDKYTKELMKDEVDKNSVESMRKEIEKLKLTKELSDLKSGKDSLSDALKKAQDEANYEQAIWRKEEFAKKNADRKKEKDK